MKTLIVLSMLCALIACNDSSKETKTDTADKKSAESTATTSTGDNAITFKVDGKDVVSEGWVVQRFVWDDKTKTPWLNIVSDMHKEKQTINVNLNGAVPGTYNFTDGRLLEISSGSYYPDYSSMMDSYSFKSGSFNITEVDTVKGIVNGTFSGTVTNTANKSFTITEGKIINAKLKSGVTNISKAAL